VNVPPIVQRHPALRWLAPIGVACVAGLAATGVLSSNASPNESLPPTTPTALIAAVQQPNMSGFSGTVVSHLALGLPDLPQVGEVTDGTSFTSLLTGSHTLRVWYGGPTRQRIALLGSTDEADLFHDGPDLWQWNSADHRAVHAVLPEPSVTAHPSPVPSALSTLSPVDLARQLMQAMDETTKVGVEKDHVVADRSAYTLVLTPRTARTKVGSVHIAIDGQTKVPLGVQVFARGANSPAVDVSFSSIDYGRQSDRTFEFTPPAGSKIQNVKPSRSSNGAKRSDVSVTGSGWTRVVGVHPGSSSLNWLKKSSILNSLTPVAGSWGHGRLLDSPLLSMLVTSDGRVFAGTVAAPALYAAAGRK
jgi:outer membrane lipoprotein-sorting protein